MSRLAYPVAAALVAAAAVLVPGTASADAGPRCRVVTDPMTMWTPAGPVTYYYVGVYCD